MAIDPRALAMVQSPTAAREQMAMQQTFANVQFASNLVMSKILLDDQRSGPQAMDAQNSARELREAAKQMLITYFANLRQEQA